MGMRRGFIITIYDKFNVRKGWVSNPVAISVTERWLAQSTGELTVRATDPGLPFMLAEGARVSVRFGDTGDQFIPEAGYQMISGMLRNPRIPFLSNGLVTFQIEGDWRILRNSIASVVPSNPLQAATLSSPAQSWDIAAPPPAGEDSGRSGYFHWPSGPADAQIATQYLIDQQINTVWMSKFGEPGVRGVSGGWSAGSGADVSGILPQVRFGSIESYVVPLLRAGGIGLRFFVGTYTQSGQNIYRITANYWQPKVWGTVFTPESGVVTGGEASLTYPEATDIIVGGPGELSARAFRGVADSNDFAARFRDIVQVFREATGAPVEWPTTLDEKYRIAKYYHLRGEITADQISAFETFMQRAGESALADGAMTSGVSLSLAESEGFRFTGDSANPRGFATGDVVTVAPSTAAAALKDLRFTDRITEVTASLSDDKGLTVTPQLGKRRDDPDIQTALAIQQLALANNRRSTNQ